MRMPTHHPQPQNRRKHFIRHDRYENEITKFYGAETVTPHPHPTTTTTNASARGFTRTHPRYSSDPFPVEASAPPFCVLKRVDHTPIPLPQNPTTRSH